MSLCNGVRYLEEPSGHLDPYYDVFDSVIMLAAEDYRKAVMHIHKYFPTIRVEDYSHKMVRDSGFDNVSTLKEYVGKIKKIERFFMQNNYIFYDINCPGPVALSELQNSINSYFFGPDLA